MCRVLGCVAADPVSLRHELLEAPNPIVRQSEVHDSGWGMAVYRRGEGEQPVCTRFPDAAFSGEELAAARAFADLSHRLVEESAQILEVHLGRHVELTG